MEHEDRQIELVDSITECGGTPHAYLSGLYIHWQWCVVQSLCRSQCDQCTDSEPLQHQPSPILDTMSNSLLTSGTFSNSSRAPSTSENEESVTYNGYPQYVTSMQRLRLSKGRGHGKYSVLVTAQRKGTVEGMVEGGREGRES